jgi:hypothetical protein
VAEPVAHAGNTRSAPLSTTYEAPPKRQIGARSFSSAQIESIRRNANAIKRHVPVAEFSHRILILQMATLVDRGEVPEDAFEQTLESFARLERPPGNPLGWIRTVMRNQCAGYGIDLETLLKTADFPPELLQPPTPPGANGT